MPTMPGYICPFCQMETHHPRDRREHYCNRCHIFATDVLEMIDTAIAAPQPAAAIGLGTTALITVPVNLAVAILNVCMGEKAVRSPILQEHPDNKAPLVRLPLPLLRHARLLLHNATRG